MISRHVSAQDEVKTIDNIKDLQVQVLCIQISELQPCSNCGKLGSFASNYFLALHKMEIPKR
jgi:hypothetical protein